ncbi:2-isopropylmalate synthase [Deinococcus peraridilitoris]|uniref:2-isopropylmalate synthase n=1 Tax=Deinococcus peraridilitoris (strain DSM 19664 / LMG 22246 / CIP 109416 / KR-200) TaxID=937777 RepID=K9ZVK6_DEIPD|nr:2-isopropylmalate synthase [Deinococcus peraridilitoris]AFZ65628.1 2-isopropylmalate synthase, bacterial type [Deinococcus peraridilitoris DSM 19664]
MRRIQIFDTTLRDGEQSPGVALNHAQKIEIAHALARLGVDIIESGFPITSDGDFECVSRIAREVRGPTIAALARTARADIERAAQALETAPRSRIHVFTSASKVQIEHMLRKTPEEVLESSVRAVKLARQYTDDVEFSGQDVMRADFDFVIQLYRAAIEAGATVINIPDTVGYGTPQEYGALIARVRDEIVMGRNVAISTHCHDDLGMATANSLAAVENGATQIECTLNGIGERAGNTSLEEVVMAIHTRRDHYRAETGIHTREIYRVSRMVSRLTGMPVPPNKAIVGDNAFAHESGIHQDGVLKHKETYEIMNAELVGREAAVMVMGKHSGRAAFRKALADLGYVTGGTADHGLNEEALNVLFTRFKELADRKGQIYADDLRALVDAGADIAQAFTLDSLQVLSGTHVTPVATVRLNTPDGMREVAATGDGPVAAAFNAITQATEITLNLETYRIQSVTRGSEALGEVSVSARYGGVSVAGIGLATDVVEASARAWLHAINQIVAGQARSKNALVAETP